MFLGGIIAGGMLVSSVVRRRPTEESGGSAGQEASRSAAVVPTVLALAAGVPLLATQLVPPAPTWAAFADTATASSSFHTLTTAQLQPALNGCSATAGVLTVTWSDPSGAVPERGYGLQSASSATDMAAGPNPYHWSTPLVAGDLITITARHFASWSASIQIRVATATDGSVTCSQV
jgi:hypothetical protein